MIVGIAWYRRADYARIRQIMADGEALPTTFDKWQHQAEKLEAQCRARGQAVHRAYIDPQQFPAWCAASGHDVDAKARIAWANLAALRHARGEH